MACHAVVSVWISRDLLLPFVRQQHTLWLSMKRITSLPATSSANVLRTPADARSSKGIICVWRRASALQMCSGVSSAQPFLEPSTKMQPPSPLSKVREGWGAVTILRLSRSPLALCQPYPGGRLGARSEGAPLGRTPLLPSETASASGRGPLCAKEKRCSRCR